MSHPQTSSTWIGHDVQDKAFVDQFFKVDSMRPQPFTGQLADIGHSKLLDSMDHDYEETAQGEAESDRGSCNISIADPQIATQVSPTDVVITIESEDRARASRYRERVVIYSRLFQHGSTMPHNGFVGIRSNTTGHILQCVACLDIIGAEPDQLYVPWEPPEPDGILYNLHLDSCFTSLYRGECSGCTLPRDSIFPIPIPKKAPQRRTT